MALSYPPAIDTPEKRTHYLYRAQELLRLLYNYVGTWAKVGITQVIYADIGTFLTNIGAVNLRSRLLSEFPYTEQLSYEDWDRFRKDIFQPLSDKIVNNICTQRALLKNSVSVSVNLDDLAD